MLMLLKEKMETSHFSSSEKQVVDYILEEGTNIQNKTVKEIAKATYTVPSTLIRIAKKLNYNGWNELKKDFISECEYLESHFLKAILAKW